MSWRTPAAMSSAAAVSGPTPGRSARRSRGQDGDQGLDELADEVRLRGRIGDKAPNCGSLVLSCSRSRPAAAWAAPARCLKPCDQGVEAGREAFVAVVDPDVLTEGDQCGEPVGR